MFKRITEFVDALMQLNMGTTQTPRKGKGRQVLGITIGVVVVMAITAAVVLGVVFGMKKESQEELSEIPVFLAVQSFGTSNNMTTFTVKYRSKSTCTAEGRSNQYGILGREVLNPQTDDNGISTVRIRGNFPRYTFVSVSLYCHRVYSYMNLNARALATPGLQTLVDQLVTIPFNYINAALNVETGEYHFSLNINNDKTIHYFFGGLNTSASPTVPFEYVEFGSYNKTGKFRTTLNERGDINEYNIVIVKELVNAGGIFTVVGKTEVASNYVRDTYVGISIPIRSPVTGEIVPSGHSAFYPLFSGKTLDIYEDTYSLWCYVMGNPLPRVETYFRDQTNTTVEIESKEIRVDEYSLFAVSTVTKEAFSEGGAFICRARPSDEDFELYFKFEELEQSIIDTNESGLIEQTSEKDVIRCVARGRPLPEIEIRLYEHDGPNLIDTGLFQVSRSNTNDTLASVTLTISPPNMDIHTVYCESSQRDFPQTNSSFQVIELYPGRWSNYTFYQEMWYAIRDHFNG